jgi:ATP-binding cassette subfamily B protein
MHCDSILVLDNHEIVERGTHQELMQLKGVYCELYNKQLTETEKV